MARDDVFLVSKAYPQNVSHSRLRSACEASLNRLGTDRLERIGRGGRRRLRDRPDPLQPHPPRPGAGVVPWLAPRAMQVMAYSPVEQGWLVRHSDLSTIAAEIGVTAAQLALAWTLRRGDVIAIPKAGSIAHVRDDRAALDLLIDDTVLACLDRVFPRPRTVKPLEML